MDDFVETDPEEQASGWVWETRPYKAILIKSTKYRIFYLAETSFLYSSARAKFSDMILLWYNASCAAFG